MAKRDQETRCSGGAGGLLLGLILGFGACLFIKEEERKKIVNFLADKIDKAKKEGEQLIEKKISDSASSEQKSSSVKKRFFRKRD